MTNSEFKAMKELCANRKTVEEDLQYRGYLFLQLTENQAYKLAEVLSHTGFPIVEDKRSVSGKAVQLSNGLKLHLK